MQRSSFVGTLGAAAFCLDRAWPTAVEAAEPARILAPKGRPIEVHFALSDGANVVDLAGAWETFQDVSFPDADKAYSPFAVSTVGVTRAPVTMTGGLSVVPKYTFADAPKADVVIVGAQRGNPELLEWLTKSSESADLVMSVCTGAFKLAATGLLAGRKATTHHDFYDEFAKKFPDVHLIRGPRYVEDGKFACAGGLTSGIALALRVTERYFSPEMAKQTARYMEFTPTPRPA